MMVNVTTQPIGTTTEPCTRVEPFPFTLIAAGHVRVAAAAGLAIESMIIGAVHATAPAAAAFFIIERRLTPRASALSVKSCSLGVGDTGDVLPL
jgi:hypothetical protein